jgi:DNA-binding response OmpR family regulator
MAVVDPKEVDTLEGKMRSSGCWHVRLGDQLRKQKFDLMFLDLQLPDAPGIRYIRLPNRSILV